MVFSIDLDRGIHMRSHPTLGMDVYMYVDDPGIYYDAHGNPVTRELAEQAGFPVEEHEQKHKVKVALEEAQADVLKRFSTSEPKKVKQSGNFYVMDIGMGRFNVYGPGDDLLNKAPISREQAEVMLKHLAPEVKPKAEATAKA